MKANIPLLRTSRRRRRPPPSRGSLGAAIERPFLSGAFALLGGENEFFYNKLKQIRTVYGILPYT